LRIIQDFSRFSKKLREFGPSFSLLIRCRSCLAVHAGVVQTFAVIAVICRQSSPTAFQEKKNRGFVDWAEHPDKTPDANPESRSSSVSRFPNSYHPATPWEE
jgi:hypothetical protein